MLFKNAMIYTLNDIDMSEFQAKAQPFIFSPLTGAKAATFGWVNPLDLSSDITLTDEGDQEAIYPALEHYAHEAYKLLCCKIEEKVIPGTALSDATEAKIKRFEEMEGREIRAKERQQMREDALMDLLPRALTRWHVVHGYVEKGKRLVLNTTSNKDAETFLALLRVTLDGSIGALPMQTGQNPAQVFTKWLSGTHDFPKGFYKGYSCDMVDPEDGSKVTIRGEHLDTGEVTKALEYGKQVHKVNMIYGDISFNIDKDMKLSQIKLLDRGDNDYETEYDRVTAGFVETYLELNELMGFIVKQFGGEQTWLL
jgi:recombination associated protein RdgC